MTSLSPGGQAPPIAIAGRDVVVQPGETLTLNGIESLPLDDAHISTYSWKQKDGAAGVTMEVKHPQPAEPSVLWCNQCPMVNPVSYAKPSVLWGTQCPMV